jgi:hypothetical protein
MLDVVRQVSRPGIAFKILGPAGCCDSDASVEEAFWPAFSNITQGDVLIVGMWSRFATKGPR